MTEQPGTSIELSHAAHMPAPQGGALPTGLEWAALEKMATLLADSNLIPYQLKGKPGDVAVILLAAREYGIPPLMALSKLPVVNGKPAPMGELMVALVLRAGHYIAADFRNPDGTVYAGGPITREHYGEARYSRRDWPEREFARFTIAEGIAAGLLTLGTDGPRSRDKNGKPQPWEQYTPNMARWRAVANACRLTFPDVLLGLSYLPEELGAIVDEDGAPIMGTVEPPAGAPRSGTIEQRTAQDAADKLSEQPWADEVLERVRQHASDNGYLDADVDYGGRMTLREALAAHVEARTPADVVEAELVEDPRAEAATATEEQPQAPPADAQIVPDPEEAPVEETPQDAAYDLAREVLKCNDAQVLLSYYNGATDLLGLDVMPVIGDADLATLEAPDGLRELSLGRLIINAGKYVKAHGIAVSDPAPVETADPSDPDDPWAKDAATGWPDKHNGPPTA